MTSAEFTAWIVRSLALALAALLAQYACPGGRGWRAALPLAAFAGLIALTIQDYFHGPQLALPAALAVPATWAAWPGEQPLLAPQWMVGAWLAGVAFLLAREGAGAWRLGAIVRAARPLMDAGWQRALRECGAQLRLTAPVELRLSDRLGPAATGLRRRIILLPPECLAWTDDERRFILLHELAHFRHGDLPARLFARAVCALQWFNPFAWLLARRMDFDREAACDAAVVAETAAPGAYAETLLTFAESPHRAPALAFTFGAPRRTALEARIVRLLAPVVSYPAWRRRFGAILALAALTIAGMLCACSWQQPVVSMDEVRLRLTADPFPGEP